MDHFFTFYLIFFYISETFHPIYPLSMCYDHAIFGQTFYLAYSRKDVRKSVSRFVSWYAAIFLLLIHSIKSIGDFWYVFNE